MEILMGSTASVALDDCAASPTLAASQKWAENAGGGGGTGAGCRKEGCLLRRRLTVTKDQVAPEIAAGFASEVSAALERTIVGQRARETWRPAGLVEVIETLYEVQGRFFVSNRLKGLARESSEPSR
jgi:hypothetical protein